MPISQLPPFFFPLFCTVFVVNTVYLGAVFLLRHRLAGPVVEGEDFTVPRSPGGSSAEVLRMLGFVFSGRHNEIGDLTVTRLTWAIRFLFPIGLVLTLSIFVLFLRAM
ncbi:hypothetical protein BH10PSE2_BH10PSE2_14190 [soil metagenome]